VDISLIIRLAIVVAAALVLSYVFVAYVRRDRHKTQHMLDHFLGVIDDARVGRSPWGYERMVGSLDGSAVKIDLIPDNLITRTLPTLWLELCIARPQEAFLCVIVLCNGMEYFADEVDEGTLLPTPAEWPESVRVRGTSQASVALLRRVRDFDIAAYHDLKLLVFSESGLKVVMRCARGDVPLYRVLRAASFPEDSVKPDLVDQTVRLLRDLEHALDRGEEIA
jgi:hypothetical protein